VARLSSWACTTPCGGVPASGERAFEWAPVFGDRLCCLCPPNAGGPVWRRGLASDACDTAGDSDATDEGELVPLPLLGFHPPPPPPAAGE